MNPFIPAEGRASGKSTKMIMALPDNAILLVADLTTKQKAEHLIDSLDLHETEVKIYHSAAHDLDRLKGTRKRIFVDHVLWDKLASHEFVLLHEFIEVNNTKDFNNVSGPATSRHQFAQNKRYS